MNTPLSALVLWSIVGLIGADEEPGTRPGNLLNADFTAGDTSPTAWTLHGGQGRWVDRDFLEVTGTGNDSSFWRCDGVEFTPGALCHFQFRGRRIDGSGTAVAGPMFANRDYRALSKDWQWYGHVFRVPEKPEDAYLRLGQWHATGSVQFDAVRLMPALPVHRAEGPFILGEGETIRDGLYEFHGLFGHPGSNDHRTLDTTTAGFNSDRWVFGPGSQVTYRFQVPGHSFLSGRLSFHVNYHTHGACLAEVSRDGSQWQDLVTQEGTGVGQAALSSQMLPAESIFVRLRPVPRGSQFQVNRVEFQGRLDGRPADATGKTDYAAIEHADDVIAIDRLAIRQSSVSGQAILKVTARNTGRRKVRVQAGATISDWLETYSKVSEIAAGGSAEFALDIPAEKPGEHRIQVSVSLSDQPQKAARASVMLSVPDFYRADYGQQLECASGNAAVWWCDAMHKIPRLQTVPEEAGSAARMSAARHDYEAVQVVVRPNEPLQGLRATADDLKGPLGAVISSENVNILRVYYHFVQHPTDQVGARDWWPDALPPLEQPIDVEAGHNQPLWVLVYVPKDARAGDYAGTVSLEAEGFSADVPLKLHVWDFALPERNHVETAFGFSAGNVFRYHGLRTDDQKRKVLEMYFNCFSEHRISPYDPVPLDPIRVDFRPDADPPRADVDFSDFEPAFTQAVEKFHFTGFRLPIQGMGGGTFHARYEPEIADFTLDTPQYQAMFSSYVKQLEDFFRRKGWLDLPYIYWFDEPAPKDYEFVRNGFQRLKKYAPGLQTMLTEEPVDALAGPVDIWCPLSVNYDHEAADRRRAHGERFWWYVCTGPKAPYCTLFIDHPATELRVWLWQTWRRNIVGILVWQATYWTSSAAFPDQPQNPYQDPMGYVSGYSTPKGVKRFWGNGDGRFIYPPLAAATPGISGSDPVLAPPVSSIRWEMLREGIEDYEFLYRLRQLLVEKRNRLSAKQVARYQSLLEVPESITKEMVNFTTDPTLIYTRRAAIAHAIEDLVP